MVWSSHNNVIQNFDFQQLTASNEVPCDFDVGFGRSWVAARMIVHNDNSGCAGNNRQSEYFAWMDQDGIHRSGGNKVMAFDFPACVQDQDRQAFAFRIEVWMLRDMQIPIFSRPFRRVAHLKLVRCGTFPQ